MGICDTRSRYSFAAPVIPAVQRFHGARTVDVVATRPYVCLKRESQAADFKPCKRRYRVGALWRSAPEREQVL